MEDKSEQVVAPVVEEQLVVHTDAQPTHGIRVHRRVETHAETIDMPVTLEQVEIRRIVKNEVVNGPLPVRQEGNLLIVPVVEEEVVVTRRFVLKEEVHVQTTTVEKRHSETVNVSRQHAEVQHLDQDGKVTGVEPASTRPLLEAQPKPIRKSLLEDAPSTKASQPTLGKTQLGVHLQGLDPKRNRPRR